MFGVVRNLIPGPHQLMLMTFSGLIHIKPFENKRGTNISELKAWSRRNYLEQLSHLLPHDLSRTTPTRASRWVCSASTFEKWNILCFFGAWTIARVFDKFRSQVSPAKRKFARRCLIENHAETAKVLPFGRWFRSPWLWIGAARLPRRLGLACCASTWRHQTRCSHLEEIHFIAAPQKVRIATHSSRSPPCSSANRADNNAGPSCRRASLWNACRTSPNRRLPIARACYARWRRVESWVENIKVRTITRVIFENSLS